ncbi:hypothetical protein V1517DRAFT_321876 [Lipomyces orientalis]|uniref:Uncharacterized protein n=1 Tax=Lipomyces orientalis TaxID=1233043 RepID=A0ACC3TQ19_9ASCO
MPYSLFSSRPVFFLLTMATFCQKERSEALQQARNVYSLSGIDCIYPPSTIPALIWILHLSSCGPVWLLMANGMLYSKVRNEELW